MYKHNSEFRNFNLLLLWPVMFQLSVSVFKAEIKEAATENINNSNSYSPLWAFFCPFPRSARGDVKFKKKSVSKAESRAPCGCRSGCAFLEREKEEKRVSATSAALKPGGEQESPGWITARSGELPAGSAHRASGLRFTIRAGLGCIS